MSYQQRRRYLATDQEVQSGQNKSTRGVGINHLPAETISAAAFVPHVHKKSLRKHNSITPPLWGKEILTLRTKKFTRFSWPCWSPRMARSIFRANVLWRRRLPGGHCRSVARELLWNGGVLFSAFGQPGTITRFCVIWRNVTSLQLIYVASPDWTSRNHTHVDTAGPKTFTTMAGTHLGSRSRCGLN